MYIERGRMAMDCLYVLFACRYNTQMPCGEAGFGRKRMAIMCVQTNRRSPSAPSNFSHHHQKQLLRLFSGCGGRSQALMRVVWQIRHFTRFWKRLFPHNGRWMLIDINRQMPKQYGINLHLVLSGLVLFEGQWAWLSQSSVGVDIDCNFYCSGGQPLWQWALWLSSGRYRWPKYRLKANNVGSRLVCGNKYFLHYLVRFGPKKAKNAVFSALLGCAQTKR